MLLLAVLALLSGCRRSPTEAQMSDPDYPLYEKVRAGAFQLSVASASIVAAVEALDGALRAAPKAGEPHEALLDVRDYLESAGDLIAKHIDEPPPFPAFKPGAAKWAGRLRQAAQDANDAYMDLAEADGLVQSIEAPGPALNGKLQELSDAIAAAQDDLASALEAMGAPPPYIAGS